MDKKQILNILARKQHKRQKTKQQQHLRRYRQTICGRSLLNN